MSPGKNRRRAELLAKKHMGEGLTLSEEHVLAELQAETDA